MTLVWEKSKHHMLMGSSQVAIFNIAHMVLVRHFRWAHISYW